MYGLSKNIFVILSISVVLTATALFLLWKGKAYQKKIDMPKQLDSLESCNPSSIIPVRMGKTVFYFPQPINSGLSLSYSSGYAETYENPKEYDGYFCSTDTPFNAESIVIRARDKMRECLFGKNRPIDQVVLTPIRSPKYKEYNSNKVQNCNDAEPINGFYKKTGKDTYKLNLCDSYGDNIFGTCFSTQPNYHCRFYAKLQNNLYAAMSFYDSSLLSFSDAYFHLLTSLQALQKPKFFRCSDFKIYKNIPLK